MLSSLDEPFVRESVHRVGGPQEWLAVFAQPQPERLSLLSSSHSFTMLLWPESDRDQIKEEPKGDEKRNYEHESAFRFLDQYVFSLSLSLSMYI